MRATRRGGAAALKSRREDRTARLASYAPAGCKSARNVLGSKFYVEIISPIKNFLKS